MTLFTVASKTSTPIAFEIGMRSCRYFCNTPIVTIIVSPNSLTSGQASRLRALRSGRARLMLSELLALFVSVHRFIVVETQLTFCYTINDPDTIGEEHQETGNDCAGMSPIRHPL